MTLLTSSRACALLGMVVALCGCESNGGGSMSGSVSVGYGGYYGGYYPGYPPPGYWYDNDGAVVIRPPENRPERPTTLPAHQPATRPSAGARPMPTMSRPAARPMPRARGR